MSDHYNIPMEDLMAIEVQINNREAFDELVKTYQYDDAKTITENLKSLGILVVNFLKLEGKAKANFLEYCVEKNIPIEVNFKPLKVQQLHNMIEEWLSLHTESSTIIEKLYSNNHRNLLFKRVLFEERETIDDYFKTLSEATMLRGVDLYQLLVDILSPYQLYEYNIDSETFFEKVNSLNSFLSVVNRFIHSEKRIAVGINSSDIDYVRRFEFDRLIEFWEGENYELILLSQRRNNHLEKEVQTMEASLVDSTMQTDKVSISLSEIINEALSSLNKLTSINQNIHELEAIERIYSFLRKQKIGLLQKHQQQQDESLEKNSQKTQKKASTQMAFFNSKSKPIGMLASIIDNINLNETIGNLEPQPFNQATKSIILEKKPINTKLTEVLRSIYNIYFAVLSGPEQVTKCFTDIGASHRDVKRVIEKILTGKNRLERKHTSYPQFEMMVEELMVIDCDLTAKVLEQFLKLKLDSVSTPSRLHRYYDTSYDCYGRYL